MGNYSRDQVIAKLQSFYDEMKTTQTALMDDSANELQIGTLESAEYVESLELMIANLDSLMENYCLRFENMLCKGA